ncbi:MAG: NusG domain II-containing protein [Oscillospiraceae bacterium]|nr:NusG domain II-containing protein [Oscillospiraceae bacterium]
MRPRRWEAVILGVVILALLIWALWPGDPGAAVSVSVNGQVTEVYPLDQPTIVSIDGYGGFLLTLVVSDGSAHVEYASCPDLICQHHRPISSAGEQIVCLPARIVLTVTGKEAGVDAVTR